MQSTNSNQSLIDWADIKMKLAIDLREKVWSRKLPTAWGNTIQESHSWDDIAQMAIDLIQPHLATPVPVMSKEYQYCSGSGCGKQFEVTSDTAFYCKDCQASLKGNRYVD